MKTIAKKYYQETFKRTKKQYYFATENDCKELTNNQKNFIFLKKIGNGNFSQIYLVKNRKNKRETAMKIETKKNNHLFLKHEATIIQNLHLKGCKVIPIVDWFGKIGKENIYGLSLTLFSKTINEIEFNNENEIIKFFANVWTSINAIHCLGIVHCDIKPENIMIDINNKIKFIDFGMSQYFIDAEKRFILPQKIENSNEEDCINDVPFGTPNYVSIWVHQWMSPYPRDDICSLLFVLYYLLLKFQKNETKLWDKTIGKSILIQKIEFLNENINDTNKMNIANKIFSEFEWLKNICDWEFTFTLQNIVANIKN